MCVCVGQQLLSISAAGNTLIEAKYQPYKGALFLLFWCQQLVLSPVVSLLNPLPSTMTDPHSKSEDDKIQDMLQQSSDQWGDQQDQQAT